MSAGIQKRRNSLDLNTKSSSPLEDTKQEKGNKQVLNLYKDTQNTKNVNQNGMEIKINNNPLQGSYQAIYCVEDSIQNNNFNKKTDEQNIQDLKRLFPYDLGEIIIQIAQAHVDYQSEAEQEEREIKRVKQSRLMFILIVLCSLVTATENLYIFLGTMPYRDLYFMFPTAILRVFLLPIVTLNLCRNWTLLLRLTFMVDKIMLSAIMEYIGVMGFIMIFIPYTPVAWVYQALYVLYPLIWLMYTANFRVMMLYCQWSKVEVIIYKMSLLIGATCYFILGVHYLVNKLRFTRGLRPQLDDSIESLLLIYINAGFQVYLEMVARMDTIDGSGSFKLNYKLHCDPQDMQSLLRGRRKKDQNSKYNYSSQSDSESDSSGSEPTKTEDKSEFLFDKILFQIDEGSDYSGESQSKKQGQLHDQNSSRRFKRKNKPFETIDFSEHQKREDIKQPGDMPKYEINYDPQSILDVEAIQHKQLRKKRKKKASKINFEEISVQSEIPRESQDGRNNVHANQQ